MDCDTGEAEAIGSAFLEEYYSVLHIYPDHLHLFYAPESRIGRTYGRHPMVSMCGDAEVKAWVSQCELSGATVRLAGTSCMTSYEGNILVLAKGTVTPREGDERGERGHGGHGGHGRHGGHGAPVTPGPGGEAALATGPGDAEGGLGSLNVEGGVPKESGEGVGEGAGDTGIVVVRTGELEDEAGSGKGGQRGRRPPSPVPDDDRRSSSPSRPSSRSRSPPAPVEYLFAQTFVLARREQGYFILTDILVLEDSGESAEGDGEGGASAHGSSTSRSLRTPPPELPPGAGGYGRAGEWTAAPATSFRRAPSPPASLGGGPASPEARPNGETPAERASPPLDPALCAALPAPPNARAAGNAPASAAVEGREEEGRRSSSGTGDGGRRPRHPPSPLPASDLRGEPRPTSPPVESGEIPCAQLEASRRGADSKAAAQVALDAALAGSRETRGDDEGAGARSADGTDEARGLASNAPPDEARLAAPPEAGAARPSPPPPQRITVGRLPDVSGSENDLAGALAIPARAEPVLADAPPASLAPPTSPPQAAGPVAGGQAAPAALPAQNVVRATAPPPEAAPVIAVGRGPGAVGLAAEGAEAGPAPGPASREAEAPPPPPGLPERASPAAPGVPSPATPRGGAPPEAAEARAAHELGAAAASELSPPRTLGARGGDGEPERQSRDLPPLHVPRVIKRPPTGSPSRPRSGPLLKPPVDTDRETSEGEGEGEIEGAAGTPAHGRSRVATSRPEDETGDATEKTDALLVEPIGRVAPTTPIEFAPPRKTGREATAQATPGGPSSPPTAEVAPGAPGSPPVASARAAARPPATQPGLWARPPPRSLPMAALRQSARSLAPPLPQPREALSGVSEAAVFVHGIPSVAEPAQVLEALERAGGGPLREGSLRLKRQATRDSYAFAEFQSCQAARKAVDAAVVEIAGRDAVVGRKRAIVFLTVNGGGTASSFVGPRTPNGGIGRAPAEEATSPTSPPGLAPAASAEAPLSPCALVPTSSPAAASLPASPASALASVSPSPSPRAPTVPLGAGLPSRRGSAAGTLSASGSRSALRTGSVPDGGLAAREAREAASEGGSPPAGTLPAGAPPAGAPTQGSPRTVVGQGGSPRPASTPNGTAHGPPLLAESPRIVGLHVSRSSSGGSLFSPKSASGSSACPTSPPPPAPRRARGAGPASVAVERAEAASDARARRDASGRWATSRQPPSPSRPQQPFFASQGGGVGARAGGGGGGGGGGGSQGRPAHPVGPRPHHLPAPSQHVTHTSAEQAWHAPPAWIQGGFAPDGQAVGFPHHQMPGVGYAMGHRSYFDGGGWPSPPVADTPAVAPPAPTADLAGGGGGGGAGSFAHPANRGPPGTSQSNSIHGPRGGDVGHPPPPTMSLGTPYSFPGVTLTGSQLTPSLPPQAAAYAPPPPQAAGYAPPPPLDPHMAQFLRLVPGGYGGPATYGVYAVAQPHKTVYVDLSAHQQTPQQPMLRQQAPQQAATHQQAPQQAPLRSGASAKAEPPFPLHHHARGQGRDRGAISGRRRPSADAAFAALGGNDDAPPDAAPPQRRVAAPAPMPTPT